MKRIVLPDNDAGLLPVTDQLHAGVDSRACLDVQKPGYHTVMCSMRDDGFEMDH